MLNRQDFKSMKDEFKRLDDRREEIILLSRDVIKLSKQLIYSVHRENFEDAAKFAQKINKEKIKLEKLNFDRVYEPSARVAIQEYVEAMCFYGFAKSKKLVSSSELKVSADHYLLGLCDLGGELVRKAINAAIKGDNKEALLIKDLMTEIYGEFLQFDFRNGDLRKKFDGMKYDLKKLEDLAFQITLKK